ncbi:MAG: hypothetical protein M1834_002280 [Cirrosporium novae-zelandiae]|nr:MAG: hypothetical protein M1834_002280 [Cirrosporium novae-zelandiae]
MTLTSPPTSGRPGESHVFSHMWLRDNCPCPKCIHPYTRQKLVEVFSMKTPPQIDQVEMERSSIHILWSIEGHKSEYPLSWLLRHAINDPNRFHNSSRYWDTTIKPKLPTVRYHDIMVGGDNWGRETSLGNWLKKLRVYGFCFVEDCPPGPKATKRLLERIAFIRETHYGGFYDFTSDLASKDMAYTSLGLDLHTDTTYFTDPAGLQMFHLLSHTEGSGGATLLVDGFSAAKQLIEQDKDAYRQLESTPVPSHASGNQEASIQPYCMFPVLNHHPQTGQLTQIRWNNSDRGTFNTQNPSYISEIDAWYIAAKKWSQILNDPKNVLELQLQPGKPLIFDNWRILHGRTAFTGKRRMCGGYINHDDFMSRYRLVNYGREEVLQDL